MVSRLCRRVSLIATLPLAMACAAQAFELKDCEQDDSSAQALRACSALLDRDQIANEERVRILVRRGRAWFSEDEPAEAVKDFSNALKIEPQNAKALIGRAHAHEALKEHKLAAEDWASVISVDVDAAEKEAHTLDWAASLNAAGDTEAALTAYGKLLEANPKSIKAHIGRAKVYLALDNREKTLAELQAAQDIDPKDTAPYIARGEAAEHWGNKQLAIDSYMFVVKNNTRSAGPYRKALQRLGVDTPP